MMRNTFSAIGTTFTITVWDTISQTVFYEYFTTCVDRANDFDNKYSRFKKTSIVSALTKHTGIIEVPEDLVRMLTVYERFANATNGKITPTIGHALEDIGYDAEYSLREKTHKRPVYSFTDALHIIDATHIDMRKPVLLDLGALGKGYLIDMLYEILYAQGLKRFLVDGSGDIRYQGDGVPIVAGLEHPNDATTVVGTIELLHGSLCASAINRRRWGTRHHYIDPHTGDSPEDIIATWVLADTAVYADGLASALFFVSPEALSEFTCEYFVMNKECRYKSSAGFTAELFV